MKKNPLNEASSVSLEQTLGQSFWRWFSFSVLALALAAALPARSADVFIDEGDGDFAATPVSSPAANLVEMPPAVKSGPGPASEDSPIANPGSELDSQIGQLEPASPPPIDPMAESSMENSAVTPVETPKPAVATKSKPAKKKEKKSVTGKSSKKKTVTKNSSVKKKDKKTASKKSKKNTASVSKKSAKRKVASIAKFAGGQYATTSKECALESAPGAGDTVGTSKAARKLWVEESGNTSYWKVYGKAGGAAYLPRDCF